MGRLTVASFVTLDGVIQSPGMPDEDTENGFRHGGWQVPFFGDESEGYVMQGIERMDAMLLGRKTYDIFAGYWPKAPADDPIGAKFNAMPKYVATRTLRQAGWNHTSLIEGDLADAVHRIKRDHSEIQVFGSANLVQSLLRHDLVDRLALFVYPLMLGTGKRLFQDRVPPTRFQLIESRAFDSGSLMAIYEPVGKPVYGTAARDEAGPAHEGDEWARQEAD